MKRKPKPRDWEADWRKRAASNKRKAKAKAMELRERPTFAESKLKEAFEIAEIPFSFQVPFADHHNHFVADFFLYRPRPAKSILVEVDGPCHQFTTRKDQRRDNWFETTQNCVVLRYTNDQVFKHVGDVVYHIALVMSRTEGIA